MTHTTRTRFVLCALAAMATPACASRVARSSQPQPKECDFVVHNLTRQIMEVRLQTRPLRSVPIGTLAPGELLNHSVPCTWGAVWVTGIEVRPQSGARLTFGAVQGMAELIDGERVRVALHWP